MSINPEKKIQRLKDRRKTEHNSLRYQKLVAEIANRVIEKDSKRLTKEDYSEIALKIYKRNDKITIERIRNMMKQDEAIEKVNNAIQMAYIEYKFDLKEAMDVLNKSIKAAVDTKDAKTLFAIHQYLAKIHDKLPTTTRISETRTEDYQPGSLEGAYNEAQKSTKIVKKIEIETQSNIMNQTVDSDNDQNSKDS